MWHKNKIYLAVLVVAVVVGGFFLFNGSKAENPELEAELRSDIQEGEVFVKGKIACLPFSGDNAGGDCVKGIKGEDGTVYALDSIKVRRAEADMEEGTPIFAIGKFQPATESGEASVFSYDGVLVLSELKMVSGEKK